MAAPVRPANRTSNPCPTTSNRRLYVPPRTQTVSPGATCCFPPRADFRSHGDAWVPIPAGVPVGATYHSAAPAGDRSSANSPTAVEHRLSTACSFGRAGLSSSRRQLVAMRLRLDRGALLLDEVLFHRIQL